jgi:hypothetical protein
MFKILSMFTVRTGNCVFLVEEVSCGSSNTMYQL